jgi:hypothetical protein
MQTIACERCQEVAGDLLDVIQELAAKKKAKWRGSVTIRFDGSGRIISTSSESYREIRLTKHPASA